MGYYQPHSRAGLRIANQCVFRDSGCTERIIRQSFKGIKKHLTTALYKGTVENINSSILQHLAKFEHHINPNLVFTIVHLVKPSLLKRA